MKCCGWVLLIGGAGGGLGGHPRTVVRDESSLTEKLLRIMTELDLLGNKTEEEAEAVIFLLFFFFPLCECHYADESATSGRSDWPWRCNNTVIG